MREQSKWLLFDLGGVLMNFIGVPELAKLAGKSLEDTRNTLFFSAHSWAFQDSLKINTIPGRMKGIRSRLLQG